MTARRTSAKRNGGGRKAKEPRGRAEPPSPRRPLAGGAGPGGAPAAVEEPDDGEGLVLQPPVASLWTAGDRDLKVPTVALTAEILFADGSDMLGRMFVPASASSHAGAMRPEEWMNEPVDFFPFLPDAARSPIIVNKHEVLILSVPSSVDADLALEAADSPRRRVTIECGGRRLAGTLIIDMPQYQSRVLDYLNRAGRFLTLRDGDRHHLIQKQRITRVEESREE